MHGCRIDPAASLGLTEGDAHVIRNAGGRASDALRCYYISKIIGNKRNCCCSSY